MDKIKKSKIRMHTVLLLLAALLLMSLSASASGEEKIMVIVGDKWEKDNWNLSIHAVDKTAMPMLTLISLSYQGKKIGDAKIERGKSYTYMGRNPDGSKVPLFTIKENTIFIGASNNAVRLTVNWSVPGNGVDILEKPEESGPSKTEIPESTQAAQTNPEAPGFEVISGLTGLLVLWRKLKH